MLTIEIFLMGYSKGKQDNHVHARNSFISLRHGIVHTPHTHSNYQKCLKYDWFLAHNQRAESQTILFRNLKFEIFGSV